MKKIKIMLLILLSCLALVATVMLVCYHAVSSNADGRLYIDVKDVPEYEVGLLLGCAPISRITHEPTAFFTFRIDAAEALYKAGKVRKILISGDKHSFRGINEVQSMRDSLAQRGVPDSVMILDGESYRTQASVERAVKEFGYKEMLVISQQFHNERTLYIADHSNLGVERIAGYNAKNSESSTALITYAREYLARVKMFLDLLK